MWFKNVSDKLSLTAVLKRFELNAPSFFSCYANICSLMRCIAVHIYITGLDVTDSNITRLKNQLIHRYSCFV